MISPNERLRIEELVQHPWLNSGVAPEIALQSPRHMLDAVGSFSLTYRSSYMEMLLWKDSLRKDSITIALLEFFFFFDILQNSYSVEHLWKAASDLFHEFWFIKFREIKQCSIKLKHLVRLFGSNFCDKNSNSDHFIFILETKIHWIVNCSLRIYTSYTYKFASHQLCACLK